MVIVARGASRNVRIVRMYPLTVLFTITMVIIINCILRLTSQSAHSHHPTGECAGFAQKLHPLIISKISDIVDSGITNITDIKRSLRWYVQNEFAEKFGAPPKNTNRSLYPTDNDIRNHVYIAKKAMEFSKLDQEIKTEITKMERRYSYSKCILSSLR